MNNVPNFKEIVSESNGLWVSALFGAIVGWNPNQEFTVYKNMFFDVVKELLDNQVIRFCSPQDPLGKDEPYWNVDSDTIISYLKEKWPQGVTDENDEELNNYFYFIPAILWSDGTGHYIGS